MQSYLLKAKELLEQKKISNLELAQLIGKNKNTISNYFTEKTKIDIDTFIKISKALNVPVGYFFDDENIDKANDISFNYQRLKGDNNILSNGKEKKDIAIAKLRSQLEFFTYRAESCESIIKEKERVIESLNAQIELLIDKN